jgi:hypothetical protein
MKRVSDGQFSLQEATKMAAAALKNSLSPEQIVGLTQAFDFLITHVANVYKSRHH